MPPPPRDDDDKSSSAPVPCRRPANAPVSVAIIVCTWFVGACWVCVPHELQCERCVEHKQNENGLGCAPRRVLCCCCCLRHRCCCCAIDKTRIAAKTPGLTNYDLALSKRSAGMPVSHCVSFAGESWQMILVAACCNLPFFPSLIHVCHTRKSFTPIINHQP